MLDIIFSAAPVRIWIGHQTCRVCVWVAMFPHFPSLGPRRSCASGRLPERILRPVGAPPSESTSPPLFFPHPDKTSRLQSIVDSRMSLYARASPIRHQRHVHDAPWTELRVPSPRPWHRIDGASVCRTAQRLAPDIHRVLRSARPRRFVAIRWGLRR